MGASVDPTAIARSTRRVRTARACAVVAALLLPLNIFVAAASGRTGASAAKVDGAIAIALLQFALGVFAVVAGARASKGQRPVVTIVVGALLALTAPIAWLLGLYLIAASEVFR